MRTKRTKTQPSVAGLLLVVTGMLLLSILLLNLASTRRGASADATLLLWLGGAAVASLVSGAILSARKGKSTRGKAAKHQPY
jgi:uncharacterized membrane protein YdcZ (DUF606 family)